MDYGHPLEFGVFLTPAAAQPQAPVALSQLAESAGLDLVTFQDHPYQPSFLDAWTLMTYVAAQTERVQIAPNVLNLPLRPPAVLARSAASLDLLSGGRFALGIGSGGFWDAIASMGGRKLTPGQGVAALEEAIDLIRALWDTDARGGVFREGRYYGAHGAKRGPRPAHEVPVWIGAYKPKMLSLTGRKGDGWLPSLGYMKPGDLARGNAAIDDAAAGVGRDPRDVRRLLNIGGPQGDASWPEQLAELALTEGTGTFILATDDPAMIRHFGEEIAPEVRRLVAAERGPRGTATASTRSATALAQRADGIAYDDVPAGIEAIEPGDFRYSDVRSTYMRGGRPGIVLQPESAAQVAEAVAFARRHPDVPLSIRSGGHGISGRSTNDGGIVIDLRKLNGIEVIDADARLVRIGPGARWMEVAAALGEHGWALTSGDYGAVGVGGLATAGGVGWLAREHGLTIDHIRAVEVVLADGSIVHADAEHDPELFWAVRGAGANVGIVTSFDFEVDEIGTVGWAQLLFDASDATAFVTGWGERMQAAPRDLTGTLMLIPPQQGQPRMAYMLAVVDSDDPDTVIERLQPFAELAPLRQQQVHLTTYPQVMANADIGPQHGSGEPHARSALVESLTEGIAQAAANLVDTQQAHFFQIRAVGGAVADVAGDATAYAHRSAAFSIAAFGSSDERLDAGWAPLAAQSMGLYLSFDSSSRPERIAQAFPPATLARLRAVKQRVDPDGVFADNFSVRDSG